MKRCLPLFTILCLAGALVAQPPVNDECTTATVVGPSNLDNGTMTGNCNPLTGQSYVDATPWEVSPGLFYTANCWGGAIDSVVFYTFVAQGVSGSVEVTNGPGVAQISVITFGSVCNGATITEVGCGDGMSIEFDNQLTIGTTYYVVVSFENSVEGNFSICIFNPVPAVNDLCTSAINLQNLDGDGTACNTGLDNYYPSSEALYPACFPADETWSVWYSFVAQGVSIAELYIQGAEEAHMAVWDFSGGGSCNLSTGTILACETNVTSTNAILLDNQLTIGNTYYIEVVFVDNDFTGNFSICLDNPEPAFNDDCMNALVYPTNLLNDSTDCHTDINGEDINNDWPSTDIGVTYGCWDAGSSYSVWYTFTAQGPDLDVTVDALSFAAVEQIAVIEFTGSACDPNNWVIWDCITGSEIDLNNTLEIGHTYYVGVGFSNNGVGDYCINIFNPEPPENDTMCGAIAIDLNGTSTVCANPQPTTIYANPEFDPNSFPGDCAPVVQNTVWYTMQMSDPNNVGFSIDVDPSTLTGDVSIVLFEMPDCDVPQSFSIAFFYCGPAPADPIEWGPINDDSEYYLMIGSSDAGQGDFSLCVSEIPPCFNNNFCSDPAGLSSAFDLGTPETQTLAMCNPGGGPTFICVMGCNEFADPEPGLTACTGPTDPVVWYTFTTDAEANILNMTITSEEMDAPSVQLFLADGTPHCETLILQGLTPNNFGCMVGSNGNLIANSTSIGAQTTYYIAVGGVNTLGGEFEICISTLEASAACVTDAEIVVESRSFGGSLQGPFFPGEVLEICMNVNNFQVATGIQNCQWFQGLVPVFGNGWDPTSFDNGGMPLNATLNGQEFPNVPNVENSGTWNWWTDVHYHHPHCYYNVGDFDGNGSLDICNGLYDVECVGPGLSGGCCGPCWDQNPGDLLPPGWFTAGVNGSCGGQVGWPAVDWGDGNTCSGPTGPWEFCFELMIRPYPDCDVDESTMDLSLGFVTFADGEVGSWTGGPSVCGQDEPLFVLLPGCCTELVFLDDVHDPFCSGGVFSWELTPTDPNAIATFWTWTVESPSTVVGHGSGSGPPGTVVIDNLTSNSEDVETVIYHFLGFDGGDCPSVIWDVSVDVYPPIMVEMEPFDVCGTPTSPYTIIPIVSGGDPSTYSYTWQDGTTGSTFLVTSPSAGQQYILTVTDAVGCSGTASVVLNVYTTFPVEIDAPITEQCLVDGPIDLSADASGGTGTFTYNWEGPSGQMLSGPNISADESGEWLVIAEDSDGCQGRDSVVIFFHLSPEVDVFPEDVAVCPDNPVGQQIQALVTGGEAPYSFEWDTPGGTVTTPFILVDEAGDYSITVTDNNTCTAELQFEVFEQESPEVELNTHEPYCPDELAQGVVIEVVDDPTFIHFSWTGGMQGPQTTSITVTQPGYYRVTVTNEFGCRAIGEVEIEVNPDVMFDMPDTIPFCAGNFLIVDAVIGWVNGEPDNAEYEWDGPGTSDGSSEQILFQEALYFITVTDDNGCTGVSEFYALPEAFITIDIIGDSVICNGIPATIIANSGFASYVWSTTEQTQSITVTQGDQFYYVTVSDGDGCFGVDSVYVPASSPAPGIQGQSVCEGSAATLDVGNWPQILWSTNETTSTIMTDTTGTFAVTVTDAFGCTNTATYTVTVASNPVPDIQGATSFCAGTSTILNAGGMFDTYEWSTGANTPEITVNTTSTVWVLVTNAAGCVGSDTISVSATALPTPNITGDTSICNGVPVQLSAGAGFAMYQWSVPGSGPTLDVSTPGTYGVTVTDGNGCTAVDQIVVLSSAPVPVINGIAEVCEGGNTVLSATAGFANYQWSGPGGNTPTLNVNATGVYTVTVTDIYGCQATASHSFTVHPDPTPSINGSSTFCPGSDTELDAGAGYAQYQWSGGGGNGQYNTVSTSGPVSVTVTDGNGCTGVASLNVQESNTLTLNPQNPTICQGQSATLSVGNFDTYEWSTSAMTPTINVTAPGTYGVTVTDGGCSGTANIIVTVNPIPFAVVTASAQACNDAANGSTINFTSLITGGDASGTWVDVDNSGATGSFPVLNFDGVAYGVYTFEYTTGSALPPCMDVSYQVEVSIGTSPELIAAPDLCNDGDQLDLTTLIAAGVPGGGQWVIISTPPGSNPATINGTTFNTTNADPGNYTVQYTLTGIPGNCPNTDTQIITVNPEPDAGFAASEAQVCVGDDELVTLNQLLQDADAGGVWIETSVNPSTGNAFNSVAGTFRTTTQVPGTYTFEYTLSGSDPCPDASTTVEVTIENVPVADAGTDGSITCDITAVTLGGSGSSTGNEFDYLWTTGDGEVITPDVLNTTVNQSGTYTLTVINNNTGCSSSDDVVVILVGDIPSDLNMIVLSPACIGDPAGSAQVQAVTGGTPPYSYSLNGAVTTTPTWTNLAAGDYTLIVTDNLGCQYERQFTITTANDIDAVLTGETLVEAGDNAVLGYDLIIGVADSTVWSVNGVPTCFNCDSIVFTPIGLTQVQVTIYDPKGCEVTLFTNIQVHVTRNVYIPNIFSPNGDGTNDFFTLFASNTVVLEIEYLEVFSRWGDKIYAGKNLMPGVPEQGWDGKFAGEELMPGVYVFHAKVRYADGVEEIFKGDITLIR